MDIALSKIVRSSGFNYRYTYDTNDVNLDHATHKFVASTDPTEAERKAITEAVRKALTAANFAYSDAAFEKLEAAKGPNYWAFAIREPFPRTERALDRDANGNLIYANTRKRVPNT